MISYRTVAITMSLAASVTAAMLVACDTEEPTRAILENAYPVTPAPGGAGPSPQNVVYEAWWAVTLFDEPVLPGAASNEERSVPATDYVYAVLAPGWDQASGQAPTRFVALKSKAKIGAARGETLHIRVSDETFAGNCHANQPLSQADADIVTQRIFPGIFRGMTYDAKTCSHIPTAADDATPDSGAVDAGAD